MNMKTIYKLFLAALAAAVALTSCTKDIAGQGGSESRTDGVRTIAVSFETPTKSRLYDENSDELQPVFEVNDKIMVSNGKKAEICSVEQGENDKSLYYFTTELKGHLTAVYPAECADMDGAEIAGILVPERQSGLFKDANIAVASIDDEYNYAIFKNKTAVLRFYVDESIGVLNIDIKSASTQPIANAVVDENGKIKKSSESLTSIRIVAPSTEESQEPVIEVVDTVPVESTEDGPSALLGNYEVASSDKTLDQIAGGRFCYVSILPTKKDETYTLIVTSNTLSYQGTLGKIKNEANLQQKTQLGKENPILPKRLFMVERQFSNVSLPAGTLANVFMPYMISIVVGTDENDKPICQRWGYCNVGAFVPEETGKYFAWGDTLGFTKVDNHQFNWTNCPFNDNESEYSKTAFDNVVETICPDGELVSQYDAATKNWGNGWRLPTKFEVEKLHEGHNNGMFNDEYIDDLGGSLLIRNISQVLLFPRISPIGAGIEPGNDGTFWTSTLNPSDKKEAYVLYWKHSVFNMLSAVVNEINFTSMPRYAGAAIRPIFGPRAIDGTGLAVEEFDYQEGTLL